MSEAWNIDIERVQGRTKFDNALFLCSVARPFKDRKSFSATFYNFLDSIPALLDNWWRTHDIVGVTDEASECIHLLVLCLRLDHNYSFGPTLGLVQTALNLLE
jgi:hypothetical protein